MADDNPDKTARKSGKPADAAPAAKPMRAPRTLNRRELETLRTRLQNKFH